MNGARRLRVERGAVTGLLVVCLLLAGGLALSAWVNYRAASRAARDVLYSRAAEAGASFAATARTAGLGDDDDLQRLTGELAGADLGLAVIARGGAVVAASGALAPARNVPFELELGIRGDLRLGGQAHRFDETHKALVYYRLLRARGPGRGGPWQRWLSRLDRPGQRWRPGARGRRPLGPPGPPDRRGQLLRVVVPYATADALLSPARYALGMGAAVSASLLLVGLALHRSARRTQRAERELRRREALSALGEMAAVLAHEIRTPLASIKGNAQLIGEGHPGDERVGSIVSESSRLERLVNGLLDFARPAEPRRARCDPDQVLDRAAEIVAPRAQASGIGIVRDPARCGERLLADHDQLLQVLVNLLQNAIEATAGAGRSDPVVARVRRGGGAVTFEVLDRGDGLGDNRTEQLVRPFFTTKAQGSGLGLSVARQIAEQHGGRLLLEPREGGGVCARVELPEDGGA